MEVTTASCRGASHGRVSQLRSGGDGLCGDACHLSVYYIIRLSMGHQNLPDLLQSVRKCQAVYQNDLERLQRR